MYECSHMRILVVIQSFDQNPFSSMCCGHHQQRSKLPGLFAVWWAAVSCDVDLFRVGKRLHVCFFRPAIAKAIMLICRFLKDRHRDSER